MNDQCPYCELILELENFFWEDFFWVNAECPRCEKPIVVIRNEEEIVEVRVKA